MEIEQQFKVMEDVVPLFLLLLCIILPVTALVTRSLMQVFKATMGLFALMVLFVITWA